MSENAKCKTCRAVGEKLFLKGERCFSPKCAVIRKPYPPGVHGKRKRRAPSEYGRQLQAKQKLRALYGVGEKQFQRYIEAGRLGEQLMSKLEARLDNTVFRAGFALSRSIARQLVGHGHFTVNSRRVDVPSFVVGPGMTVAVRPASRSKAPFQGLAERLQKHEPPAWIQVDSTELAARIVGRPTPADTAAIIDMPLVVEYYSR
ncbi:30S ribosomal protein S4 [Candidatus Parcubacteria bacterium]|nr:30S ribosomal protein S4 [Candidatus Parcubacteria bacterium]